MHLQETYGEDILRVNERHFAVTFLLDTSSSMGAFQAQYGVRPIDELNRGLNEMINSLKRDGNADIIDISVVTFGNMGVRIEMPHTPVSHVKELAFTAGGATPMGAGLLEAARVTNERRRQYGAEGVSAFKPWIFMITDGAPTDSLEDARQELMRLQQQDKLKLWILGIPGYTQHTLEGLTQDGLILELADFDLASALNWVNKSITSVSNSNPGDKVKSDPIPQNMSAVRLELT